MRIILGVITGLLIAGIVYYFIVLRRTDDNSIVDTGINSPSFPENPVLGQRFLLNGRMYEFGLYGRNSWIEIIPFPENPVPGQRFIWRNIEYEYGVGGRRSWTIIRRRN